MMSSQQLHTQVCAPREVMTLLMKVHYYVTAKSLLKHVAKLILRAVKINN